MYEHPFVPFRKFSPVFPGLDHYYFHSLLRTASFHLWNFFDPVPKKYTLAGVLAERKKDILFTSRCKQMV